MLIIAEIGVNWDGDFRLLKEMMYEAKLAGCDLVKFQAFTKEMIKDNPESERLAKSSISKDNVQKINDLANEVGIEWFCTPMYPEAVDFLNPYVKRFKIREVDARPLLENKTTQIFEKLLKTNKEIIISSEKSPRNSKYFGLKNLKWLYCVPKYPCKLTDFDFSKINLDEMAEKFQKNILKLKKLISLGDIFQANLTTKCEIESSKNYNPLDIYLKIRRKLRAPFGGIIINNDNYKEAVLSTSPERFIKIDNKNFVESRPIKGTRSRDKDLNQDALNAIDLITNEKDRAENIMIVDLIRNDLSKVCETGSIMVPEILKLESFLKVHHLTSVIRGKLKKDKNWIDLLKACWPGGSITGAPKLRSCQRLFELEECERGPYCGSFLKLDWNGEFDSNILIRSFLIKDKKINIYAGCGIVIDSNPEEETNELKWKLLPLIDSLK